MLEERIEYLKQKLNSIINEGLDSKTVYNLSVELDRLIVEYYEKNNKLR